MLAKVFGAFRWIGKHWAISLTIFLVLAITLTTIVCWNAFGKEKPEYEDLAAIARQYDLPLSEVRRHIKQKETET